MKSCGIRASVIDHLDHAAKHLLVAVTTILRYESGYAAHHVTKTFAEPPYAVASCRDFICLKCRTLFAREETGQATAILVQRPENKIHTGPFSCTVIITVPADITCPQEQR